MSDEARFLELFLSFEFFGNFTNSLLLVPVRLDRWSIDRPIPIVDFRQRKGNSDACVTEDLSSWNEILKCFPVVDGDFCIWKCCQNLTSQIVFFARRHVGIYSTIARRRQKESTTRYLPVRWWMWSLKILGRVRCGTRYDRPFPFFADPDQFGAGTVPTIRHAFRLVDGRLGG